MGAFIMCARFAVNDMDEKLKAALYRYIKQTDGSIYGNVTKRLEYLVKIGLAAENFEDFPTKVSFLSGPGGIKVEQSAAHKNLTKRQTTLITEFDKKFGLIEQIPNDELRKLIQKSLKVIV